jgi:hypothetical protein
VLARRKAIFAAAVEEHVSQIRHHHAAKGAGPGSWTVCVSPFGHFRASGSAAKKASSFRCHGHRTIRARVSVEQSARFGWERYVGIDGAPIGMRIFGELAPFAEAREEIWLYGRRCRFRCRRATKIAQSDNTISPNLRRPARKGPRPLNWCHYAVRLPRKGNVADRAIARFARAYADRTETDHQALQQAVKSGRIPAEHGV